MILTLTLQKELSEAGKILRACQQDHQKKNVSRPMIGVTEKNGKNSLDARRHRFAKRFVIRCVFKRKRVKQNRDHKTMTAFVFIFVYYLSKPIFAHLSVSDRNRFFIALTCGLTLETAIFAINGTSGYNLISPQLCLRLLLH